MNAYLPLVRWPASKARRLTALGTRWAIKKFGNIAAVQWQFGHKNAAHSTQYARVASELLDGLNDR